MKIKPMSHWDLPIINKSKSGGVIFPPSVSCIDVTKSDYTRLWATFCTSLC